VKADRHIGSIYETQQQAEALALYGGRNRVGDESRFSSFIRAYYRHGFYVRWFAPLA
jgi:hypothetical protein